MISLAYGDELLVSATSVEVSEPYRCSSQVYTTTAFAESALQCYSAFIDVYKAHRCPPKQASECKNSKTEIFYDKNSSQYCHLDIALCHPALQSVSGLVDFRCLTCKNTKKFGDVRAGCTLVCRLHSFGVCSTQWS